MSSYFKGGRGVKAPYESITKRVPLPIADAVDKLVMDYRAKLAAGDDNKLVTGNQLLVEKLKEIIQAVESEQPGYKPKSATRLVKKILELKIELENL